MKPEDFLGTKLPNGFEIERVRVSSARNPSGGCHSMGFVARGPDGRSAFVKVLDTTVDRKATDPLLDIKNRVDAYLYERDIVFKTAQRKMSAVVRPLHFGEITSGPPGTNPAYYLLFELAQGDLREQVDLELRFDLAYRAHVTKTRTLACCRRLSRRSRDSRSC